MPYPASKSSGICANSGLGGPAIKMEIDFGNQRDHVRLHHPQPLFGNNQEQSRSSGARRAPLRREIDVFLHNILRQDLNRLYWSLVEPKLRLVSEDRVNFARSCS